MPQPPITRIETSLSHRSNNYKSGLQALKTVNKMYNDGSINRETYEFNLGIIESWSETAPMFIEDLNKLRKRIESMNEQE